jgi:CheY-like chemotaxis protein
MSDCPPDGIDNNYSTDRLSQVSCFAEDKKESGTRILIVDDDKVVQLVVKQLLGKLGYVSDCVSTGHEAINLYQAALKQNQSYVMVLMDLSIHNSISGTDTARIIKTINPSAKVILFSGYTNDRVVQCYKEHGFDGVLRKPFSFDECAKLLESILT